MERGRGRADGDRRANDAISSRPAHWWWVVGVKWPIPLNGRVSVRMGSCKFALQSRQSVRYQKRKHGYSLAIPPTVCTRLGRDAQKAACESRRHSSKSLRHVTPRHVRQKGSRECLLLQLSPAICGVPHHSSTTSPSLERVTRIEHGRPHQR